MPEFDIARSLSSPPVYITLSALGLGLLLLLAIQVSRIPARLRVLMLTAFVDMIGVFLTAPLIPFLIKDFGGAGVVLLGLTLTSPEIGGLMQSSFNAAQLVSAPFWGRLSDRVGRRPALIAALCASAIAYLVLGFAGTVWLLFLARLVQGTGGGTVSVIQAYVADSTAPEERARALGWLSAATNLGVSFGPVLAWCAVSIGKATLPPQEGSQTVSALVPGVLASLICVFNVVMAARHLPESNPAHEAKARPPRTPTGQAVRYVISRAAEPSSRLIWIYAIAIGASQGTGAVLGFFLIDRFHVDEKTIMWFWMYQGAISVFARMLLLGRLLDRLGEARLSRIGIVLLAAGLGGFPFAESLPTLALTFGLIPLGTAFTFPCVTGLLSRIVAAQDRGLYMGVQQTFGGAARIVVPLFYSWSYSHISMGSPWMFGAVLVLATMPLGFGLGRFGGRREKAA